MKYLSQPVATAVLAFGVATASAEDLLVTADTAFVPFEFKKGDKLGGFEVNLWDGVSTELSFTDGLRRVDFACIIPGLHTGQIDVAMQDRPKVLYSLTTPADGKVTLAQADNGYDPIYET